jgi:hypothetical protein
MIRPGRDRPFGPLCIRPAGAALSWPSAVPPGTACPNHEDVQRMSMQARIASLAERHAALDRQIMDQDRRPKPDDAALARMKLEKLRLKEEMERLRKPH